MYTEIIDKAVYKKDYENITEALLFVPVDYKEVIKELKLIVDSGIFY